MRFFFLLLPIVFLFNSCAPEEDDADDDNPSNTACVTPVFTVSSPQVNLISIALNFQASYVASEVQYGAPGFAIGSGTIAQVPLSNPMNLGPAPGGSTDVYVRTSCGADGWSAWAGPLNVMVLGQGGGVGSCAKPQPLTIETQQTYYKLRWNQNQAGYFEIQYGVSGFQIGSGTQAFSNTQDHVIQKQGLSLGNPYDVYVRANCGGSDWSYWEGPVSFFAQ